MSTSRALAAVAIGTLTLVGCIQSQRTAASADTAADDTAEAPDAVDPDDTHLADTAELRPDAGDDTSPGDTAVRPDADPDTVAPYCDEHDDCALTLGPCDLARCVDHACVVGHAEAGTPCDNGSGQQPGSCIEGRFQAPDRCDADGECLDGLAIETSFADGWLSGSWFFIMSTIGVPDSSSVTMRGDLAVTGGDLTLETTGISQAGNGAISTAIGNICLDDRRGLRVELGADRVLRGAVTANSDVIAAADLTYRALLVAVRGDTNPIDIAGTYDFVTTSLEPAATLRTWSGSVPFEDGCQAGLGSMQTTDDGAIQAAWSIPLGTTGVGCFSRGGEGAPPLQLELQISAHGGATPAPIRWRGAGTADGAVIIMTRDDENPNPRYGTIVLVRRPTVNASINSEGWTEVFQGIRVVGQGPVGEHGYLRVSDGSSVAGSVWATGSNGPVDVTGTYATGASGLISLLVHAGTGSGSYDAGYLARRSSRGDVAVFHTITAGTSGNFDAAPATGSLGLLVNRPDAVTVNPR